MRVLSIAAASALIAISANPAAAQNFEDRWSIIPKAHAEQPLPQPDKDNARFPNAQSPIDSHAQQIPSPATEPARSPTAHSGVRSSRRSFSGKASFYSYRSGKTASGVSFNRDLPTAAHRSLPFGTKVRVTNIENDKSVVVTITDRGPNAHGRVLDLSLAAARTLGMTDRGVTRVHAEVL